MVLHISRKDFLDLEVKATAEIAKPGSRITEFNKTHELQGTLTTKDAVVQYFYNPGNETLSIEVGKKLSLAAKIAPHQVLEAHIFAVIHELEPLVTEDASNEFTPPESPDIKIIPKGDGPDPTQFNVKQPIPQKEK